MSIWVQQSLTLLREVGALAGLPMLLVGLALMVFGWRLWRLCIFLTFSAVAAIVASSYLPADASGVYPVAVGILAGSIGCCFVRPAVAILGAMIGVGLTQALLGRLFDAPAIYAFLVAGALAGGGFACIQRNHVIILVTSFLGALCFASGLTAILITMPALYGTFRAMASSSSIVAPFMIVVPMVMSAFYQVAETHKMHTDH